MYVCVCVWGGGRVENIQAKVGRRERDRQTDRQTEIVVKNKEN